MTTIPIGYDPERDVLDIIPGYHRIDGHTVRAAEAIDADLRAERGISPDDVEYCDDCGRPWGDCDTTVEH